MERIASAAARLKPFLLAMLLVCSLAPATAAYPDRPITISVPFGAGSFVEVTLRLICEQASRELGQPIVVENRGGGQGRLGLLATRGAAPDGYTLTVSTETLHVFQPLIDPKFTMRPGKDFEFTAFLFSSPMSILVHPSVPAQDMKGLVAYAKANPGKLNMAVTAGATPHFAAVMLKQATGMDLTIVPYKSQTQLVPDLMTGRVEMTVSGVALKPNVEAGQLVALATTGEERWNAFPQARTVAELGYGFSIASSYYVVAPAGTPASVLLRLNTAFRNAMKSPAVSRKLSEGFMTAAGSEMSGREFSTMVDSQLSRWGPVIRGAGIKLE